MVCGSRRPVGVALALTCRILLAPAPTAGAPHAGFPPDAEIRSLLAERLGEGSAGAGIVVGLVGPGSGETASRRIVSYGSRDARDPLPLDGDAVFEIGSLTKVFTSLLLAEMAVRGEVDLAEPVARCLPATLILPSRGERPITLADLATHTSGLPFMPTEATVAGAPDPSSEADLERFLARSAPPSGSGVDWDYSNLGYWLLQRALTARGGAEFEALLRARVLLPLGMKDTGVTLQPALRTRLVPGHDASLQPAALVSSLPLYDLMPAAGGLVSTVSDLTKFLAAAMGNETTPLAGAMRLQLETRRPMPRPGTTQALGWVIEGEGDEAIVFHDGGTLGYASAIAWDPKRRRGVIVLANYLSDVGDLARHLLRPEMPLAPRAITRRAEIALDAATLDSYAGRYEAAGEGVFIIGRELGFLTIDAPPEWGLPSLRLRPESRTEFFSAELPLRVVFEMDAGGRVSGMLIHPPRGQKTVPARRLPTVGGDG
jgi:CubicO group peptidase (beta-lactamase class C family)